MIHHGIAIDERLEQAEEFVRAGDYLEAQARTRLARDELRDGAEALPRVARALRRCDVLVAEWQAENAARSAAHVARERKAIGADKQEPAEGVTGWSKAAAWLLSTWPRNHASRRAPI